MKINFIGDIGSCLEGVKILAPAYGFTLSKDGITISVTQKTGAPIVVERNGMSCSITYDKKIEFFRALGLFLEHDSNDLSFCETEVAQFDTNGAMFDVSQSNAVMRVDTIKEMLMRMAVMGLNMFMLYTEDNYSMPEHPYFGYMRGRYTQDELRECDDFANLFGIEMIPCIQTLAHLMDFLRWPDYYELRDDSDTLLVGSDAVYQLIDDMIRTANTPFRSKRIHIGMDEAWNLGLGNYLHKNGYKEKFDIMNEHLNRVLEIVRKYELEPMMWGDMYFRSASATNEYYDLDAEMDAEKIKQLPTGIAQIYWDYYQDNEKSYIDFIRRYRQYGMEPIFAGGIWSWTGYSANWGMTFTNTTPALNACKKENVREVFTTIWGDNGAESNIFTNLLGLQLFAEHGYARELDIDKLKRRFKFCTGANFDDFMLMKYLDETPGTVLNNTKQCNPCKAFMWNDILAGLLDYNAKGLPLNAHYAKLTKDLKEAAQRNGNYNFLFEFLYRVSNTLSIKAELGLQITKAYKENDRVSLHHYANETLPELYNRMCDLHNYHRVLWYRFSKAMGWEILDMRYGSILARIRSAMLRISDYLLGNIDHIEELEEPRLSYNGQDGIVPYANFYGKIISASRIAAEG